MNKSKILLAAFLACSLSGCYEVSTGEKIGMITKIAKQGVFCKTWEGEIVRGGFSSGSGVNGQSFHFTVADDATAKQITDAMEAQKEVKIYYRAEFASFCRSDSESHFLTKVEISEPKKPAEGEATAQQGSSDVIKRLLIVQAELLKELAATK